ncbi:class I SAM-dependent methyltransferase [Arenimonas sp. MALMAid1274]|uniref:class I SAM-dependent methyltransferase n=1 Tax=Arenimonas sp. MALMAid1274 TaxID=3411630 RepID=UPI003B9F4C12
MADPILPFTGERYTPECVREIAYEHWHRYAFAQPLARGRRVLDAACGEGYGSAMMARAGGQVLGLDLDADTVVHAAARYAGITGLRFEHADATALDALPDASFDLILSFETLEHVYAQARMLDGFRRLLAPGGLLLVSTPDKRTNSDATGEINPHHVRELYRDEFEALLAPRFAARRLYGHKLLFQSALWSLDTQESTAQTLTLGDKGVAPGLYYAPVYYLAACAQDEASLAQLPALSLFGDGQESVYADYRDEVQRNRAAAAHIAHLEAELARLRGQG